MHDLRDYKTLTARQITTAIGQLNHNTAPKIMTHLGLRARQPQPLGNGRSRAKALKLLRRVKKAHKAGRIPFELTVTGCRIDRGSHQADRYYYDRTLLAQGWQQYDTEEDAWYFGVWIHTGAVSQINHQATTAPAPSDRYTRGFLTGRPRVFSLFMALTYAMTSPTWPL